MFHILTGPADAHALCGLQVQNADQTIAAVMLRDAYLRHHAGKASSEPPRFCIECKLRADAA